MANKGDIISLEIQPALCEAWKTLEFEHSLEKSGLFVKLKSSDFLKNGKYPVIDQGEKFISGYVDEESLLYQGSLPIIIFGDHTRVLKFVDFKFAVGADGTKILKPSKEFEPKFFFYYLKSLKIPSFGYSRHYSVLKAIEVPLPPLAEQKRIVAKLDAAFAHLETLKQGLERIPELLKKFRQTVLSQAVTGNLTTQAEFTTLGEMGIDVQTGPFGSSLHQEDYVEGGTPVINPSHILNGEIFPNDSVTISNEKLMELQSFILKNNDVVLGRRGEMGRAALYSENLGPMICGTGSIILRESPQLFSKFLVYFLRSPFCVNFLTSNSVGSTMINLNQKIIKSLPFPNISLEEQKVIVDKIEIALAQADALEARYKALKAHLDKLPGALLAKAFRGELVPQHPTEAPAPPLPPRPEPVPARRGPGQQQTFDF